MWAAGLKWRNSAETKPNSAIGFRQKEECVCLHSEVCVCVCVYVCVWVWVCVCVCMCVCARWKIFSLPFFSNNERLVVSIVCLLHNKVPAHFLPLEPVCSLNVLISPPAAAAARVQTLENIRLWRVSHGSSLSFVSSWLFDIYLLISKQAE